MRIQFQHYRKKINNVTLKDNIAIIILSAAAILCGCTKIDNVSSPQRKVSFVVGSYVVNTKAENSLLDESITSFKCKAFLYGAGVNGVQYFFGTDGEDINWNATAQEWSPALDYYWPNSSESYINFVSYYDNNGTPSTATETSLAWTGRTIGNTDNILFADEAWGYRNNTATYLKDGVTGGIPTLFHHALAQISVKAKASKLTDTDGTTYSITLNSFTLKNVYNVGDLSLTNSQPVQTPSCQSWETTGWTISSGATVSDIPSTMTSGQALTLEAATIEGFDNRTVLPQETSNMQMSLSTRIRTTYGTNNYIEETIDFTVNLSDFIGTTSSSWDMNKRITYTITIDPSTALIEIVPEMKTWATTPESMITIE